jgi:hypothetical protein
MGSLLFRALLAWFAILVGAVVNGAVREAFVRPRFGNVAAEIVGAMVLSAVCFIAAIIVMKPTGPKWHSAAWQVGPLWLLMTLAFEFGFFHYIGGRSWRELLLAYHFWEGRLWIIVLISTFGAPFFAGWISAKRSAP